MKNLDDIQQDLVLNGFQVLGGAEQGKQYSKRVFARSQGKGELLLIEVHSFSFNGNGEEEEEEEEEGEQLSFKQKKFVRSKLASRYEPEEVLLMLQGVQPLPKWLQEELKKK